MGNKADLEGDRQVNYEELVQLGEKVGAQAVMEISAKQNNGIDNVFFLSVTRCFDIDKAKIEKDK